MQVIHLLRKLNSAEWGGTETAIQRLCGSLRNQGVKPVIYCPRLSDALPDNDSELTGGCTVHRFNAFVPVLGLPPERKRQLISVGGNLMSFDLITALWRETEADLIHTHALGRIGGIGRTIARQRNLPFVVSIHGGVLDLPASLKATFNGTKDSGWEWGKFFGLLFKSHRLFVDADAIITCNPSEAALLQEQHPGKRIEVQPHGVPLHLYEQDQREAARRAFPQIQGRRVLLNLGRVDPVKNQGWLVDQAPAILKRHPDALIVLAGPCTDEPYGEAIAKKIESLGISNQVLLTGALPPNDPRLIGLLQESTAVVLCSVSETFGLILIEAWAAGAPVLSSATSGAKALIRQGENGWLFNLEKPETLHEALDQTLQDPVRAKAMAAEGKALVAEEYSVDALAQRMKRLYEELCLQRQCA